MTKGDSVLESSLSFSRAKQKALRVGAGLERKRNQAASGVVGATSLRHPRHPCQAKIDRRRAVLPWLLPRIVIRILLLVHIQTDDTGKQSSEEQCEELPTVRRLVLHDGSFPKYRRTLADLLVQANSVHYINSLNVLIGWIYAPGIHKNAIICNDFADSRIRTFQ